LIHAGHILNAVPTCVGQDRKIDRERYPEREIEIDIDREDRRTDRQTDRHRQETQIIQRQTDGMKKKIPFLKKGQYVL